MQLLKKPVIHLFGMLLITAFFFIIIQKLKDVLPETHLIDDTDELTPRMWAAIAYGKWGVYCMGVSLFCSFGWYVSVAWICNRQKLNLSNKRIYWYFLIIFTAGFAAFAAFKLPVASSTTKNLASTVFYLTSILSLYFSTALFSPVSDKYAVPGSISLRKF